MALPHFLMAPLRRLAAGILVLVLGFTLAACDGGRGRTPATIAPEEMAIIARQAEGFLAAKDRLPELATLVNERDWTFTRNLIHGPMQEVGRNMLYINQRLLPADRAEARRRSDDLKTALAQLDEAARLQDPEGLRRSYIKVASGFGSYAEVIPPDALPEPEAATSTAPPDEPQTLPAAQEPTA
ncbi:MAG: photosystem II protein PsbQ [Synechococcaceae cyanobacterium]|nr:photosystem II protein PsbQ [Synechococcaceae cyanobacterium]